ncbi:MAG: excinuclease ABC subunit UvrA, partial [Rhodospirillales bacterium]
SLSAYARQFLELMQKPDVDHIDGLSPAISIEQKTTSRNPRSTVGTVTEIYDYMRLMFARVGVPHSPATGLPIESQTVSEMVDRIMAMKPGTRLYLLAPVVRGRKGEYKKEIAAFAQKGFQRIRIDGELFDIEDAPDLDKKFKHDIEVVVDRVVVGEGLEARLADSLETALELADGIAYADDADAAKGDASSKETNKSKKGARKGGIQDHVPAGRTVFSARFACPVSGFTIDEIEPRLFSFNNPFGACPACDGLGTEMFFDPELVIPDEKRTLASGAVAPWANSSSKYYDQTLKSLSTQFEFDLAAPWNKLPAKVKEVILFGSGATDVTMKYHDGKRSYDITKPFEGVIPNMERRWRETDSSWVRDELSRFQTVTTCSDCGGLRLKPEALAVKIDGLNISQVADQSIAEAHAWFAGLEDKLVGQHKEIARRILREINERLGFLMNVGLEYLSLARSSGTLSGGESQRIRLASQIGSGLTGVLYVLDEPSIGLHQRDNERLLATLFRLRDLGNTVIVVEHDEDAIRAADWIIDMGPRAGVHGGHVVATGTAEDIMTSPDSLTGKYLTGIEQIPLPARRRPGKTGQALKLRGAKANHLANQLVLQPGEPGMGLGDGLVGDLGDV